MVPLAGSCRRLERRVSVSERDGTSYRPWPSTYRVPVVAALHDPLAVLLAYDLANVVAPNNDRADGRAAGIAAVPGPRSGQIELRTWIAADLVAHVPAAPSGRSAGMSMVPVMAASFSGRRNQSGEHGERR